MRFSSLTACVPGLSVSKCLATVAATAVTASLLSPAQAARVYDQENVSLDLFGHVRTMVVNDGAWYDLTGNSFNETTSYSSARLGLGARSSIATGLDAIMMAQWETGVDANGNEGALNDTEYLFAGLDAWQYGTLMAGRGDGAYYNVVGATDIFTVLDTSASDYYMLGNQRPAQIMYSLRGLSWDLKFSWLFASEPLGHTPMTIDHGLAASISTKFGDKVTLSYGIDYYKFKYTQAVTPASHDFFATMMQADGYDAATAAERAAQTSPGGKKEYGASLSYGSLGQGLYAAAVLSATAYDYLHHHIYTVDTAVNYSFENGVWLSLGYGHKQYESVKVLSALTMGMGWNITPAVKVFAEAQFDLDSETAQFYGADLARTLNWNEDKVAAGLQYSF